MSKHRVVITGTGAVSPFGWNTKMLLDGLAAGRCSLSSLTESDAVGGMQVRVAGKVPDFDVKFIPREYRRSMSSMNIMAFIAAGEALHQAGIEPSTPISKEYNGMGASIAGTISSPNTLESFFRDFAKERSVETVRSTVFFKVMNHSVTSNLTVAYGLNGPSFSPAAACAGGLQAIGLAFDCIAHGRANFMLAGGCEEFHPLLPATFDRIGAASHCHDPHTASRPFDAKRDGIVCSEGAGILLLEEYEHAKSRGARILAEVVGFATNSSPSSIVSPDASSIKQCMILALQDANINPDQIDLINAHATATKDGDIAEGQAIDETFKHRPIVNSLKGYMGHTMAASGALELIASCLAAQNSLVHGTKNLRQPDHRCGKLNFSEVTHKAEVNYLLKNSFGLGGMNTSVIIQIYKQ